MNDLKNYIRNDGVSQDEAKRIQRLCEEAVNAISHKEMNDKFVKLEIPSDKTNFNQMVVDIFMKGHRSLDKIIRETYETPLIRDEHPNESSHKDNEPSHGDDQEGSDSQSYNEIKSFICNTPPTIQLLNYDDLF